MTDPEWLHDLGQRARRYKIVFLQLGAGFVETRKRFGDVFENRLTISEYLQRDDTPDPSLYVINRFEDAATSKIALLGKLREKVHTDVDCGHIVVLLSRIPKNAFPSVPGSDLLADARQVFAPVNLSEVALYSQAEPPAHELMNCLDELGSDTIQALSLALWEHALSPNEALQHIRPTDLESLRGAGFVSISGESVSWTVDKSWKNFREAVALVSARYVEGATSLASAFSDLWLIERTIRNVIRGALVEKHGSGWRSNCLQAALSVEVVERARRDAQPGAKSIKDLRDPLEWLSMSELLDLRETGKLGNLGLETFLWTKFRESIVPIRNRAAHMRLISAEDALTVSKWRKIVVRTLCSN